MDRLAFSCLLTKATFVWTTRKVVFVVKSNDKNTNLCKIPSLPINYFPYGHF